MVLLLIEKNNNSNSTHYNDPNTKRINNRKEICMKKVTLLKTKNKNDVEEPF